MSDIPKLIKGIRYSVGLSQTLFGEEIGANHNVVVRMETNARSINEPLQHELARFCFHHKINLRTIISEMHQLDLPTLKREYQKDYGEDGEYLTLYKCLDEVKYNKNVDEERLKRRNTLKIEFLENNIFGEGLYFELNHLRALEHGVFGNYYKFAAYTLRLNGLNVVHITSLYDFVRMVAFCGGALKDEKAYSERAKLIASADVIVYPALSQAALDAIKDTIEGKITQEDCKRRIVVADRGDMQVFVATQKAAEQLKLEQYDGLTAFDNDIMHRYMQHETRRCYKPDPIVPMDASAAEMVRKEKGNLTEKGKKHFAVESLEALELDLYEATMHFKAADTIKRSRKAYELRQNNG